MNQKTFPWILTAVLLAGSMSATGAVLVDTGEPGTTTLNGSPYRAGEVTFTANVQITSVEHFARADTPGDITFALRHDNAGVPGDEIYSTVTTLSVTALGWVRVTDLHWSVPAGTYWVTVEERPGQTATLVRPLALPMTEACRRDPWCGRRCKAPPRRSGSPSAAGPVGA